jgi:hypothetical protein
MEGNSQAKAMKYKKLLRFHAYDFWQQAQNFIKWTNIENPTR